MPRTLVVLMGLLLIVSVARTGERNSGKILGAVVTMVDAGSSVNDVRWLVIRDGDNRASLIRHDVNAEVPPISRLNIGEPEGRELDEFGRDKDGIVTRRVVGHSDATVIGVTRKGRKSGIEIRRIGSVEDGAAGKPGDVNIWRTMRGREEVELVVGVGTCGGTLELVQQFGGDEARKWIGKQPTSVGEWKTAAKFRVDVRYLVRFGRPAPQRSGDGREETEEEREKIIQESIVSFDFEQSGVRESERDGLCAMVAFLRENGDLRVSIEGHADDLGSSKYNRELGMERARAVREFLVGEGLDPERFTTVSQGECMPRIPDPTWAEREENRRVEFKEATGGGQVTG